MKKSYIGYVCFFVIIFLIINNNYICSKFYCKLFNDIFKSFFGFLDNSLIVIKDFFDFRFI